MLNIKNNKSTYVILVLIIIFIYHNKNDVKKFSFLLKYKYEIAIVGFFVFLFMYTKNNDAYNYCNQKVKPVLKPFGNRGMFYNMDINSKYANEDSFRNIYYGEFLKNLKEDVKEGKNYNDQTIPKHHNFKNSTSLDRLLKLESEITLSNSKNEKYVDENKNKFNLLQC